MDFKSRTNRDPPHTITAIISDKDLIFNRIKSDDEKTREELLGELQYMRALAKSNKQSRIMLDEMYQFVALLDPKGNLLDVNEPALHGGGMIRHVIQGIPFWECRWWAVSEETMNGVKEAVMKAAKGEFVRYEVDIFGKSAGTEIITIDFSLMPLIDEKGEVYLLLPEGRNITEKKMAEDEISRKNNELRKLYEKIKELDELKTQFFANVSHELRTPLTLITHPTEKLLKDPTLSAQSKHYLDVIARNTRGLLKHVNNLLDISKLEAGKMELNYQMVDVGQAVGLVASCFELLARDKKLEFTIVTPKPNEALMAAIDADKINRAVTNLISNAFKFTPAGGHIRVALEKCEMSPGKPGFKVSVSDTGPGVPDSMRSVIFERFRQVDGTSTRKHGGTGLGLSIVKEFIQLHGGTAQVIQSVSLPGKGAEFILCVPLSPDIESLAHKTGISDDNVVNNNNNNNNNNNEEMNVETMGSRFDPKMIAQQAAEELEERQGYTVDTMDLSNPLMVTRPLILVVEDNVEMNRFIAEMLATRYRVITALDGIEGLEALKTNLPDLIVTDCMMPRMSGDEMVAEIRNHAEYDNIPILILTAKADENLRVKLLTNGVADYVNKPFSAEELTARVSNLVEMKKAKQVLQEELKTANNDLGELIGNIATKKRDLQCLVTELNKERQLLAQSARYKDEFLMNLSHELRTPLNGILGWSQVLRLEPNPDEMRQGLESIERCANAQNQLVNDLLDMSLIIGGKINVSLETVNLSSVVEAAVVPLLVQARARGVLLETKITDSIQGVIRGDADRLQQVVWNLVSNAIKFSNEGAVVNVSLGVEQGPSKVHGTCPQDQSKIAAIASISRDLWARITVTDHGKGISSDFLPHVFERFRQADCSSTRSYGGLGLGLSIVSNIVDLHDGYVCAESQGEGYGSQFSVFLPIEQPGELKRLRDDTIPMEIATQESLQGLRIYVVDDLEETLDLLEHMFTKVGASEVRCFLTVAEAMDAMTKGTPPDVVLSDLTMPVEDGYSFIHRIRAYEKANNLSHTPVIALTASAAVSDKAKVVQTGFNLHLAKPVNLSELTTSILNRINLFHQPLFRRLSFIILAVEVLCVPISALIGNALYTLPYYVESLQDLGQGEHKVWVSQGALMSNADDFKDERLECLISTDLAVEKLTNETLSKNGVPYSLYVFDTDRFPKIPWLSPWRAPIPRCLPVSKQQKQADTMKAKHHSYTKLETSVLGQFDIICLQEMFSAFSYRQRRLFERAREQGFTHTARAPMPQYFKSTYLIDGGIVVLSKHPIIRTEFVLFDKSVDSDMLASKGVLYTMIQVADGQILHLFSTHLQASYARPKSGNSYEHDNIRNDAARVVQLNQMRDMMVAMTSNDSHPIVVAGDLNVDARASRTDGTIESKDYHQLIDLLSYNKDRVKLYDVIDLLKNDLNGVHPPTVGDSIAGSRPLVSKETILTHPNDYNGMKRLDYILVINRVPLSEQQQQQQQSADTTKAPHSPHIIKGSTKVEPFFCDGLPFTQLSDHYGKKKNVVASPQRLPSQESPARFEALESVKNMYKSPIKMVSFEDQQPSNSNTKTPVKSKTPRKNGLGSISGLGDLPAPGTTRRSVPPERFSESIYSKSKRS
eukprot:gene12305-14432_t